MAAEATIAIRALDLTRKVFLQVQRSLETLKGQVSKAGVAIGAFFTFRLAKKGVTEFANALRDVEKDAEKFGATAEELDQVTRATSAIDAVMNRLKMGVVGVVNGVLDLTDAMRGITKQDSASIADKLRVEKDAPKIKEIREEIADMRRELEAIGETPSQNFARLGDEIKRVNAAAKDPAMSKELDALMKEKETVRLSAEQRKIAIKVYEDYQKSVEATTAATQDFNDKMLPVELQQQKIAGHIENLVLQIESLQSALGKDFVPSLATPDELARMEQLTELQRQYIELLGKREILETTMQKIGRQSGEIIAQSLEDAVFAGNKLREVLQGLAKDLLRMAFREAVTAPLGAGLGGFFKNLFRAEGGPVGAGNPYIVGERGPELFVPRNSGSIISNDRLAASSGSGGGVNITYNIAAGVSRAELAPILEMERRRLKAEIPDMVRRGGAYRSAFA